MITVVRTPLRLSLFGGGTDYPDYFGRNQGAVIGFTIDKYIYITALRLRGFVDYRYRVSYSRVELVQRREEIKHPVIRVALQHYDYDEPTDIAIQSDLPASSGLGGSSCFTVGFINALSVLQAIPRTRMELAREAIFTEQELLKENVGVQDQLHAAFGGMNRFDFKGKSFTVTPINVSGERLRELTLSMVLVYTGIQRHASTAVEEQVKRTKARALDSELASLVSLVDEGHAVLEGKGDHIVAELAQILNESWRIKRGLSRSISNEKIDELYDFCLSNGALGGKLCGGGGGGFVLMLVPAGARAAFMESIGEGRCVSFNIDMLGSTVLQYPER
jgi:D-glycero-alpha-D-manno-heptose-7-phosphate kinase